MSVSATGRRSSWPILGAVAAVLVLVLAGGMYLYDHAHRDTIAKGVTIDGVPVGGLSESAALRKVQHAVIDPLNRPLTVSSSAGTWTLNARDARLTVDAQNMVAQAVQASRQGSIVTRTFRSLFGGSVHREVPLAVSYSLPAVRELTAKVRAAVDRPAQDATVQPSAGGLSTTAAKAGVTVQNEQLGGRIVHALTGASVSRTVAVPTQAVRPKVTTAQLASQYPAYIVVDRGAFQLRFYEHLKLARTYEIAVGMEGLETPGGLHKIEWKQQVQLDRPRRLARVRADENPGRDRAVQPHAGGHARLHRLIGCEARGVNSAGAHRGTWASRPGWLVAVDGSVGAFLARGRGPRVSLLDPVGTVGL